MPFTAVHHSPLAQTAEVVARHLPHVPRHACDHLTDRTPVPSNRQRNPYPDRSHTFLDDVSDDERDEDAIALQAAVDHRSVGPIN